jgi:protocatechuate 3,4-dioxygenase beta subunit
MLARQTAAREPARGGLDPAAPAPGGADELDEPLGGWGDRLASLFRRNRVPKQPVTLGPSLAPSSAASVVHHEPAPTTEPAPSETTTPVTISTTTSTGPTFTGRGGFDWRVGFTTSGRGGWIVQEIINTMDVKATDGSPVDTTAVLPQYWEAWHVEDSGTVTPRAGADNDYWIRPPRRAGTRGTWSMTGNCHFTTIDPATQGFASRSVSNAGILLATIVKPSHLGPVLLRRTAGGSWDDTVSPSVPHSGRAGP